MSPLNIEPATASSVNVLINKAHVVFSVRNGISDKQPSLCDLDLCSNVSLLSHDVILLRVQMENNPRFSDLVAGHIQSTCGVFFVFNDPVTAK